MSRELKFRAWDGRNRCWIPAGKLEEEVQVNPTVKPPNTGVFEFFTVFGTETEISQFTGLHDCKDNPIYEGDAVKDQDGNIAEIIWNPDHCQFQVDFADELQGLGGDVSVWGEVIGNKFEHPHFLRAEDN